MILGLVHGKFGMFCPVHSFFYALRLAERYGAPMPALGLSEALVASLWDEGQVGLHGLAEIARRLDGARIERGVAQAISDALEAARADLPRHAIELSWDELRPPRNVLEVFAGPMRTFVVDLAEFLHGRRVRLFTFPPAGTLPVG
jgi:hypothetical protein